MRAKDNLASDESQARIQGLRIGRPSGLDDSIGERWLRAGLEEKREIEARLARELNSPVIKIPRGLSKKECPRCHCEFLGRKNQVHCSASCARSIKAKGTNKYVRYVINLDKSVLDALKQIAISKSIPLPDFMRSICEAASRP